MSIDRIKGRLQRLHIAMQKDDLTKERFAEYEASVAMYKAALIGRVGLAEADKFLNSLANPPVQSKEG